MERRRWRQSRRCFPETPRIGYARTPRTWEHDVVGSEAERASASSEDAEAHQADDQYALFSIC